MRFRLFLAIVPTLVSIGSMMIVSCGESLDVDERSMSVPDSSSTPSSDVEMAEGAAPVVCNGEPRQLISDPQNCGACDRVCPSNQCESGACRPKEVAQNIVAPRGISVTETHVAFTSLEDGLRVGVIKDNWVLEDVHSLSTEPSISVALLSDTDVAWSLYSGRALLHDLIACRSNCGQNIAVAAGGFGNAVGARGREVAWVRASTQNNDDVSVSFYKLALTPGPAATFHGSINTRVSTNDSIVLDPAGTAYLGSRNLGIQILTPNCLDGGVCLQTLSPIIEAGVAIDNTRLYYIDAPRQEIRAVPLKSPSDAPVKIASVAEKTVGGLTLFEGALYWADVIGAGPSTMLRRVSVDGTCRPNTLTCPESLMIETGFIQSIGVNSRAVYASASDPQESNRRGRIDVVPR